MNAIRLCSRNRPSFGKFGLHFRRSFAAKPPAQSAAAKIMPTQATEDQSFIDMDTEKLTKSCCCNYLKEGTDIPIKPDSEYPAWLFKMRLGPPPYLDDLDPGELAYWKRYDEFSLKERLERRRDFFRSLITQKWLVNEKKIPEDEYRGDTSKWEKTKLQIPE